jgi:ABC-type polysaccharide/polyol phosphate export permease
MTQLLNATRDAADAASGPAPPSAPSAPAAPSDAAGDAALDAPPPHLPTPGTRPALAELSATAHDLWRVRGLVYELTLRDIRIRYKQAALGLLWALFTPALVVLAGVMVRLAAGAVGVGRPGHEALAAIAVKSVPWSFFAGAVSFATASLSTNGTLLTKVRFPREVLPISAVLAHLVDLGAGLLAVAVMLLAFGIVPTFAVLWVPVLLALLVMFATAAALALSCLNLFFRDVKYIVQVLVTFGIFFTPVFYEPAQLGARAARLVMFNPVAPMLEGIRLAAIDGHNLLVPLVGRGGVLAWHPLDLAYASAWAVGSLALATLLFARLERMFADYV